MGSPSPTLTMEGLKAKVKEVLYQPGPVSHLLAKAETVTGLDRVLLAGLSTTFLVFWLCLGYGAQLVCGVIGFIYPAYESVKALNETGREIQKRWLIYWVVKTIFLVWCMLPFKQNGSAVIYKLVIQPLYVRYHSNIETVMDKAVHKAEGLLEKAKDKVKEAVDNQKAGLLDLAVEKVKDASSDLNLKLD